MARREWAVRAAEWAGVLLRRLGRGLPGVLGPLLVCVGLGLAWLPLGVVAAGAVLWLVDLRLPDEQRVQQWPRRRGRLRAVA